MNLCIDQGNSRTKVALMTDEGKMLNHFIYKSFSSADVERLFDLYDISDSIISSVVNIEQPWSIPFTAARNISCSSTI